MIAPTACGRPEGLHDRRDQRDQLTKSPPGILRRNFYQTSSID
jgi:hypothetical protein